MVGHKDFSSHRGSYRENLHAHTKTHIHSKKCTLFRNKNKPEQKILCFSFHRISKSLVWG